MQHHSITDAELEQVIRFFQAESGIRLSSQKKSLICGRLNTRLNALNIDCYQQYLTFIRQPAHAAEKQLAIDLLTTNETYFYREPKHFEFLDRLFTSWREGRPPAIWSAACSSGEEPFTLSMLMYEHFESRPWKILASDLSQRMLSTAKKGIYPLTRAKELPEAWLKKYCLKGQGDYDGYLKIQGFLQEKVDFRQINLSRPLPLENAFDIIFLRNVLIYFDPEAKERLIRTLLQHLKESGLLILGHSESLNGMNLPLKAIQPSIYQKAIQHGEH